MKSGAPYDYLIKIILVGDTGVGKTSFLLRFTEQLFDDASHIATIGKLYCLKTFRHRFQDKEPDYGHCWLRKVLNNYINVLQECPGNYACLWLHEVIVLRKRRHVDKVNRAACEHRCWENANCDKVWSLGKESWLQEGAWTCTVV